MDDFRPAFGRRLRSLRLAQKLSQEQLAERAGVHWTYISGIERGRRSPTLNVLGRLATALRTPLPTLVSRLSATKAAAPLKTRKRLR